MPRKKKQNKNQKTIVNLFIVDKSASMQSIKPQIIEGFNTQLDDIIRDSQNNNIKSFAGLTYFGNCVYVKFSAESIDNVPKLNDSNYQCDESTAMYDGIGESIKALDAKLGGYLEACNVIVTIFTDGYENASRDYTGSQISDIIKEYRENYGWTFNFIGANIDVDMLANTLNIDSGNTLSFTADAEGTRQMMSSYSDARSAYYTAAASGENVRDVKGFMSTTK